MHRYLLVVGLACASSLAGEFPQAAISNELVVAKLYLPDSERGYYRGTRFDWSGVIHSLRAGDREYFGQWFERYDPKLHDAIAGPVEEFRTRGAGLGYDEARAGGTFIRIGVGVVRKPDESRYDAFRTYELVDSGRWQVKPERDRIEFVHELSDGGGYAYRYLKRLRLVPGRPELVIEHALVNTGRKVIETSQYNHNFFMLDHRPTGPDARVTFPFELRLAGRLQGSAAEIRGKEIGFLKEIPAGESVYGEFEGFGGSAADYDIRIEHRQAEAGVRITADRPISRLAFWCIRSTVCPEPYIDLKVEPGGEVTWAYTYQFYRLPR